jgi:hypothetical protein
LEPILNLFHPERPGRVGKGIALHNYSSEDAAMKVGIALPRIKHLQSGIATDAIGRALHDIHRPPIAETLTECLQVLRTPRDWHVSHAEEA